MPYPNEHSCRLKEPGSFQANSFRRLTVKTKSGKTVGIIIGRLKGATKTSTQAMRYPKDSWTAEEARADCEKNNGRFEAASG